MKLFLSLHDVAPPHLRRVLCAEALIRECLVSRVSYLLIPDYHGTGRADLHPEFVAWCRRPREFEIDWLLHGYRHLDAPRPGDARLSIRQRLAEQFLTSGEGEFLRLDAAAQRELITEGRRVFERCLGREVRGFVAPAWLFNKDLIEVLRETGFQYTESYGRIFMLADGSSIRSPVITWATRTPLLKWGSIAAAPILARLWSPEPMLRVALHPFDFDHPEVVASIRGLLTRLLRMRRPSVWTDAAAHCNGDEAHHPMTPH